MHLVKQDARLLQSQLEVELRLDQGQEGHDKQGEGGEHAVEIFVHRDVELIVVIHSLVLILGNVY